MTAQPACYPFPSTRFAKGYTGDMQQIGNLHYQSLTNQKWHPFSLSLPQSMHHGPVPDSEIMAAMSHKPFACSTCFHRELALVGTFRRYTNSVYHLLVAVVQVEAVVTRLSL